MTPTRKKSLIAAIVNNDGVKQFPCTCTQVNQGKGDGELMCLASISSGRGGYNELNQVEAQLAALIHIEAYE